MDSGASRTFRTPFRATPHTNGRIPHVIGPLIAGPPHICACRLTVELSVAAPKLALVLVHHQLGTDGP